MKKNIFDCIAAKDGVTMRLMSRVLVLLFFLALNSWVDLKAGCFEHSIEWLYLKPTVDQSSFAISSFDNTFDAGNGPEFFPNGKRYINSPPFHSGVRIEEKCFLCNGNALDLRFAYFGEKHTDSVSGPFLFDTIGFPGNGAQRPEDTSFNGVATYSQRVTYYGADGTFNRLTPFCFCEDLSIFLGLHFAYIKVYDKAKNNGFYVDDEEDVVFSTKLSRNSCFWGIGPQVGLDYSFGLPCFRFLACRFNARAALLTSHTWADLHYFSSMTGPAGVKLENESLWRVTPISDIKIGVFYSHRCLHLELGYEFMWYYNVIDVITGYDVAYPGDSIDLFSSFNLQGPFLALGVTF